jgi:exonuclease III
MKIITWNCNMAFRKKARFILSHHPDILVVPECEHPDKLLFPPGTIKPRDLLWFGQNQHKGLGIFSYGQFRFSVINTYNRKLRQIIPISVRGGPSPFTLLAIWANNPTDPDGQYVEQVWKALHHYDDLLIKTDAILVGDFNSNVIWDKKRRKANHSNVVKYLEERGICSTYHHFHKQKQGTEKHPTLYMYRHKDKPYHIDYCFASSNFIKHLQEVEIGTFRFWCRHSDHVPLIVTFKNK